MSPARASVAAAQRKAARAAALAGTDPLASPVPVGDALEPVRVEPGTLLKLSETLSLKVPDEPSSVRSEVLEIVLEGGAWPGREDRVSVAGTLWEAWREQLEAVGVSAEIFDVAARGYRRELWLWVVGERQWGEVVAGFAGRLWRRSLRGSQTT